MIWSGEQCRFMHISCDAKKGCPLLSCMACASLGPRAWTACNSTFRDRVWSKAATPKHTGSQREAPISTCAMCPALWMRDSSRLHAHLADLFDASPQPGPPRQIRSPPNRLSAENGSRHGISSRGAYFGCRCQEMGFAAPILTTIALERKVRLN